MHEKLSHLSREQITELLELYYDPEKQFTVADLMERFEIEGRPSSLSSYLPDRVHEETCVYCDGVNLRSKAPSRSGYNNPRPQCPQCGHQPGRYCQCSNCQQAKFAREQIEQERQREIVYRHYGPDSWPAVTPVRDISLRDAIYLKALVSHKASEDLRTVYPTEVTQTSLAPGSYLIWEVLRHLYHNTNTIAPDPYSDLSAFAFDENSDASPSFYLGQVEWLLLPGLSQPERLSYLRELDEYLGDLSDAEGMEASERDLWHEIVKHEALEYYEHKLEEVRVEMTQPGDRTNAVFDDLVNRFSLAQIYHIIYVTVRNTHHFTTKQRMGRQHAKNMYVGALERNANHYETEGWLKNYGRDFNCPQTTVSAIFFTYYLGRGSQYFEERIPSLPSESV